MPIIPTNNYVKFIKGTPAAYAALPEKNSDTLYFICETGSSTGLLYLGDQLIGDGQGTGGSLADFSDVLIDGVLADKQLLVYNATSEKWENSSITSLIDIFSGATASENGTSGLVPVPQAGDQNKFLRGDGTWATVNAAGDFDSNVFDTSGSSVTLKGLQDVSSNSVFVASPDGSVSWVTTDALHSDINQKLTTLENTVAGFSGGLQRKIVSSKSAINTASATAANYIYLVPTDSPVGGNIYDEYMVIEGNLELIGSLSGSSIDLSNYVTKAVYAAEVGDLNQLLLTQNDGNTLVDQVNALTTQLTWQQLTV